MSPDRTIYVVDDDAAVRASLKALLEAAGFTVEAYASGREALDGLNGKQSGCLLLDLRLPDMSGLDVQQALKALAQEVKIILVDMHAEATSEKQGMGWHLDGRVTAVLGTHTHVPTADERILPNGTAFQTDVGMSGPYESIIGMRPEKVLERFLYNTPRPFEPAKRDVQLRGALIDADEDTGRALGIRRLRVDVA